MAENFFRLASWRRVILALSWLLIVHHGRAQLPAVSTPVPYDQGDPSGEEQYLLEQLNQARRDPVAEGQRMKAYLEANPGTTSYYNLDPDAVAAAISALPAVPPLAFNRLLIATARAHSEDIAPHNGQGPDGSPHNGWDGSTSVSRVEKSGYQEWGGAECVAPGAASLDEIHAGYMVDWGNAYPGHRLNEMEGQGRNEVGIGMAIKPASLNSAFPLVETEDFGSIEPAPGGLKDAPALLTGVVYTDTNGNGQYDPGEGIAGVTVTMDGGYYCAVTGDSGGYTRVAHTSRQRFLSGWSSVLSVLDTRMAETPQAGFAFVIEVVRGFPDPEPGVGAARRSHCS